MSNLNVLVVVDAHLLAVNNSFNDLLFVTFKQKFLNLLLGLIESQILQKALKGDVLEESLAFLDNSDGVDFNQVVTVLSEGLVLLHDLVNAFFTLLRDHEWALFLL